MSSVEITTPTKRFPQPVDGYDRDTGTGVGHLFKFDANGKLLADLKLGEGTIYHPGGIDYDGRYIWVAVAEYRPNSRSIVYRVDPATMKATEVFRYGDHSAASCTTPTTARCTRVSWGSRRFYRFTLDDQGRVTNAGVAPVDLRKPNRPATSTTRTASTSAAARCCARGSTTTSRRSDGPRFPLGGIEIVDLRTDQVIAPDADRAVGRLRAFR